MKKMNFALFAGVLCATFVTAPVSAQRKPRMPKAPTAKEAATTTKAGAVPAQPTAPQEVAPDSVEIPKAKDESFKFSGLIRIRPEVKEGLGFDKSKNFNFVGQKVWLTAEKAFSDKTRFLITLQDARVWGGQSGAAGTDTSGEQQAVDVREAYLQADDFLGTPLSLRLGRQKMTFGDELFVGVSDWGNVGRSFDGARLIWDTPTNNFSAFSTILQEDNSNDLNNANNTLNTKGIYFSGIYDTIKISKAFWLDAFVFARNQDKAIHSDQLYTGGLRFHNRTEKGNKSPKDQIFDYSLDIAYQGGRKGGLEVQAYGAFAQVGATFTAGKKMRLGAQGAYASGDNDATDKKYQTFDPLYPTTHSIMGIADMVTWRNVTGAGVNYTVWFLPTLSLRVDYWYADRTSTKDGWYYGAANVALGTERGLYHEADAILNYNARENLGFQAGYAYANRGNALRAAGKDTDYQYGYFMSTFKFQ